MGQSMTKRKISGKRRRKEKAVAPQLRRRVGKTAENAVAMMTTGEVKRDRELRMKSLAGRKRMIGRKKNHGTRTTRTRLGDRIRKRKAGTKTKNQPGLATGLAHHVDLIILQKILNARSALLRSQKACPSTNQR